MSTAIDLVGPYWARVVRRPPEGGVWLTVGVYTDSTKVNGSTLIEVAALPEQAARLAAALHPSPVLEDGARVPVPPAISWAATAARGMPLSFDEVRAIFAPLADAEELSDAQISQVLDYIGAAASVFMELARHAPDERPVLLAAALVQAAPERAG